MTEITQEDREAAAEILKFAGMWRLAKVVIEGRADETLTVELVAKHRQAARERALYEAARVAEGIASVAGHRVTDCSDYENGSADGAQTAADDIATAIRNLAERGE